MQILPMLNSCPALCYIATILIPQSHYPEYFIVFCFIKESDGIWIGLVGFPIEVNVVGWSSLHSRWQGALLSGGKLWSGCNQKWSLRYLYSQYCLASTSQTPPTRMWWHVPKIRHCFLVKENPFNSHSVKGPMILDCTVSRCPSYISSY